MFRISPDEPWRVVRTRLRVKGIVEGPVEGGGRAQFDLTAEGDAPVELRCYLKAGEMVLTETWAFQYEVF